MKKNRIMAALLVLALMLSLAGCGGFAGRMARAAKKMEKVQSYRVDLDLSAAIKLTVLGQEMPMDLSLGGTSEVNTKPSKTKTALRVSVLGEESEILTYTEKRGDDLTSYVSPDGGATWTRQTLDLDLPEGKTNVSGLLKLASGFEKTGVETVRGSQATVYAGTVTSAALDEASDLSDTLEDLFETLDLPEVELDLKNCGSIPVTVAIDNKSGFVTRCTLDLTEFMGKLLPKVLDLVMAAAAREAGLEGMDLGALGFSLDIGSVTVAAELYDFDAVGAIEIPAEALSAPEAALPTAGV